jgi:hypothetical protein
LNEKSRVFDIIMMKNIFLGISVRDTIFLWKFFEDVAEEEAKVSHVEEIPPTYDTTPPIDPLEVEPMISLHARSGFSAPQAICLH